jgi:hypothetical protein
MKTRYLVMGAGLILLCLLPRSECFSQDPGIPDTVRFGEWSVYYPGAPDTGRAFVPLVVYNDEPVMAFCIPVSLKGPIACDSAYWGEDISLWFDNQYIDFDPNQNFLWFLAYCYDTCIFMPPGTHVVGYMRFEVYDTGWVELDTAWLDWHYLVFNDQQGTSWMPQVVPSPYHITVTCAAGDANCDQQVDIGDVVFLINYLYKGGPPPPLPELGDVNGDCVIEIGDVVYLINYLFKNGPVPQSGCD